MGKVKQVIMGDLDAEEAARKKAEVKREQKKLQKTGKSENSEKPEMPEISENQKETKSDPLKIRKSASLSSPIVRGKKYLNSAKLVDKNKKYSISEALDLVKKTSFSKFDGSVEAIFNVADKGLRGTVALPHGTGKQIRVKIADDALVTNIEKGGTIDFDILVAHPSMMPKLARIAKILGPKGLMPNPKTNTISENPEKLVENLSKGQINWKTEADFPIIHAIIGKVSFDEKKLAENFAALLKSINKEKIVSCFVKPTMGPSIRVQI